MKRDRPLAQRLPKVCLVLVLAALVALLAGCGANKEKQLVGKWVGDSSMMGTDKKDDSPGAAIGKAFAEGLAKAMSLEFRADKTFTMSMMGFPAEGTWSVNGDKVSLEVKKALGTEVPADKKDKSNMEFTLSGDGKTLTSVKKSEDTSKNDMVFKKEGG